MHAEFARIPLKEGEIELLLRLAIGARSQLCSMAPSFKLLVVVDQAQSFTQLTDLVEGGGSVPAVTGAGLQTAGCAVSEPIRKAAGGADRAPGPSEARGAAFLAPTHAWCQIATGP